MKANPSRVLVVWPHPRRARVESCLADPDRFEDADGFTYLRENGLKFLVAESSPYPWNPLAQMGSLYSGLDPIRFLRLIWAYRHFDVLVSMDSSSCFLFVLLARLFHLRKPVVVIDPAATTTYKARRKLHGQVLPFVNQVVVFGSVQARFFQTEYAGKLRVAFVHHRIDTRFFAPDRVSSPPPVQPYILSVGDDVGRDYATLMSAVAGLEIKVIIKSAKAADPRNLQNVELNKERISFEELRELYHHALFVVLPLHSTLHSSGINTLLEAMAMKKAVVVSRSEGIADYVEHGKTGWVVPVEDPTALRDGILRLLKDTALRHTLGENGRKFCDQFCAMPVYAAAIAKLIKACPNR